MASTQPVSRGVGLNPWSASAAVSAAAAACVIIALQAASGDLIVDTSGLGLPSWANSPLTGLLPHLTRTTYSVWLLLLSAGYLAAVALAPSCPERVLWGAIAVVTLALLLAPPLLSSDIYGYMAYGRLGGVHGINPYVQAPNVLNEEPAWYYAWSSTTTPYGPLFTAFTYLIAKLGYAGMFWALKAVVTGAYVAIAWLLRDTAGRVGVERRRAVATFALNPIVLLACIGGAHNDPLMMLLAVGALACSVRGRTAVAIVLLVAAALIKESAVILLPFALLAQRQKGDWLALAGAFAASAAAVLFLFGSAPFSAAVDTAIHPVQVDYSVPDTVARLFGAGAMHVFKVLALAFVAVVAVVCLRRSWRSGWWAGAAGLTVLGVLISTTNFEPWYIVWVLPLAAVARERKLTLGAFAITTYLVITELPALGFPPST